MQTPDNDVERPRWLLFLRKYIWVISFVMTAVVLTLVRPYLRHIPDPPPVLYTLSDDFVLVDHRGERFDASTLAGEVWVAGFIFTRCPSVCPAVTRAMASLRARFDRYSLDVKTVSFSVDPEYDTPEVLAAYAESVGAENKDWRFVTGSRDELERLVGDEGFRLGLGDREDTGNGVFDIAHSTRLVLVDGKGSVRGYYGIEPDGGLAEIFERADRVMMEAAEARSAEK